MMDRVDTCSSSGDCDGDKHGWIGSGNSIKGLHASKMHIDGHQDDISSLIIVFQINLIFVKTY